MAHVSVNVNGRRYDIGCDDGQEDDVLRLASELDRRVRGMAATVGQVGDARLLVMVGLLMAHELEQLHRTSQQAPGAESFAPATVDDAALCDQIERLASRIEAVARGLASTEPASAAESPDGHPDGPQCIADSVETP
jgi:cell division protein ZapA